MKNVYYICSHFTELVEYYELRLFLQKHFPEIKQHLILIEHHYFSLVNHEKFLGDYDSIIRLPVCECAYSNHWYYELLPWVVFKRLAKVRTFVKEKDSFTFQDNSLCVISEMTEATLPLRLLLKKFNTETESSTICRIGTCYHRSDRCDTNNWISWLLHNVYAIIGAYPVSVHFYGWMVSERRYYNEKEIIKYFLVFSNKFEKHNDYIEIKYPLTENKQFEVQQKRYVFFFDDGLAWVNLISKMKSEDWIATMNQTLQAITDLYENEKVILLLKSHPANKGNIPYELAGFEVYDENITAEMIYSSCKENILAVYSVTSTAARSASLYGINSYVFYELFDFSDELMNRHKRYLLDFGDVISIKNLEMIEKPKLSNHSNSIDDGSLEQVFKDIIK